MLLVRSSYPAAPNMKQLPGKQQADIQINGQLREITLPQLFVELHSTEKKGAKSAGANENKEKVVSNSLEKAMDEEDEVKKTTTLLSRKCLLSIAAAVQRLIVYDPLLRRLPCGPSASPTAPSSPRSRSERTRQSPRLPK